jgi:hypothetical protein
MEWTPEEIEERLFAEDAPSRGDAGVVFGSADPVLLLARAETAAEIHRSGLVPLVVSSGGSPHGDVATEADAMRRCMRARGVPDDAILSEAESTSTFENARFSSALLAERGLLRPGAVLLLVSSPWHLGRVVRTVRPHVPPTTRLLAIPSREGCAAATWRTDAVCRGRVETEARIFQAFVAAGILSLDE